MGTTISKRLSESNIELGKHIDSAATEIMLNSSFEDMTKLANEKHCNQLVKQVADVFQKNKDTIDLELLRKRLYSQKLDQDSESKTKTPEKRGKNPQIQNIKKKCIQISKFYVLFAHLFSCIISTINPSFKLEPSSKEKTSTTTKSESNSEGKKTKTNSSLDFCTSRLNALVNGELNENSDGDIVVKPNICKTNISESGTTLRLVDLPGMGALQQLYKDVNDGGEEDDARYLYAAFTGKEAPKHITRFDQIPLRAFNKDVECKESSSKKRYYDDDDDYYDGGTNGGANGDYNGGAEKEEDEIKERRRDKERRDQERLRERQYYGDRKKNDEENVRSGIYLKGITGSLKERLFSEYVQNIKEMIEHSETNRSALLEILSEMFTYMYDDSGAISGVIINPSLTYKKLQSLVSRTRRIIIKLYTDCEEDYKNGLDIFFAIVQEKIALTLSVRDDILKKQLEDTIYGPPERYIPEASFYQQFQGAEDFNKKQFVPPHFKSSVLSLVKKQVSDDVFRQILPTLNEWINEEVENATGLLDANQVANEFLKENIFGDNYSASSSPQSVSSAPSSVSLAPPSSVSLAPPLVPPSVPNTVPNNNPVVATPFSASKTAPPSSPSTRNVRPTRASAINPRRLSSLLENVDDDD
jgi:hypothetical protein